MIVHDLFPKNGFPGQRISEVFQAGLNTYEVPLNFDVYHRHMKMSWCLLCAKLSPFPGTNTALIGHSCDHLTSWHSLDSLPDW